MKRTIQWKVMIEENGEKIATLESAVGLPRENIESQFIIIGILENIKQKHLEILKTLYQQDTKGGAE
jgi:hypothetical protein